MAIRRKHIKSLTERLLIEHRVRSAPVPVERIIRELNIQLHIDPVEDSLSGFLVRNSDDGNAIIGVNAQHSEARRRFTMAHELGHFLLHEGEVVHFDQKRPGFTVNLRSRESAAAHSEIEREANVFAADLLMPEIFLLHELERLGHVDLLDDAESLKSLADKFGVSAQALTIRLKTIDAIEE